LKYPALSLAHLLKYYGNIKLNKKHQLSDWRLRPLPVEMIEYARNDTAYLHFLYDSMSKDLYKGLGSEGLQVVLNASRKWCLKRYEKEPFWPLGYVYIYLYKVYAYVLWMCMYIYDYEYYVYEYVHKCKILCIHMLQYVYSYIHTNIDTFVWLFFFTYTLLAVVYVSHVEDRFLNTPCLLFLSK
jgi:hypothetical protein